MQKHQSDMHEMSGKHYRSLIWMAVLSFIAMYVLMYAMVNTLDNVFNNINQVYMAGLMAAPMVPIEIFLMKSMYPDKRRNALVIAISVIAGLAFFFLIRQQGAVADKQFLRSMIPHHAGAILMCEQADLQDPEIRELCQTIIVSQQQEIDQMKAKLAELDK
jgi:dipeptide/tripeptide permease